MDQGEEGNDERGGRERVALGSVGEAFAPLTGGVSGEHRWGRGRRRRGERVRAEAGERVAGYEPSILFVRLIPNERIERFNTYGPRSRDVNARRIEYRCGGRR